MNGCNPTPDKFDINWPPAPGPAFRSGPSSLPFHLPSFFVFSFRFDRSSSSFRRDAPPSPLFLLELLERRRIQDRTRRRRSGRRKKKRRRARESIEREGTESAERSVLPSLSDVANGIRRRRRAGSLFYSRVGREQRVWLKFHRWPFSLPRSLALFLSLSHLLFVDASYGPEEKKQFDRDNNATETRKGARNG